MACANEITTPILAEDLIVSVIKDITNVPFTVNDLKTPTYEKMYSVYSGFVCNLLTVSNEQITQVPLHVMETIAHPELYIEEATGQLLFIKALEYLFSACCINEFTMNDLISPTKKRTRKLLSAVVNYAQFYMQHEKVRTDVLTKLETMSQEQEVYAMKRDLLKERIADLKAQRLEKQRAVQEMNLSAIHAKQEKIAAVKEQKQVNIVATRNGVEELQNVLTVARASKLIRQGKEAVEEHLTRGHNLAVKEKLFNDFGEVAPSVLKLIQSIDQNTKKIMTLSNEVELIKDSSTEQSRNLKDILSDTQNSKRLIKSKIDKKQRVLSQHDKKMELCRENENKLEKKQMAIFQDVECKQNKLKEVRDEMKKITEETLLCEKEHKQSMKAMQETYNALQTKLTSYHNQLTTNCQEVNLELECLL